MSLLFVTLMTDLTSVMAVILSVLPLLLRGSPPLELDGNAGYCVFLECLDDLV